MSEPQDQQLDRPPLLKVLGPGLLFAGAAIGVSHLALATQAGALYGLALAPVIVLAHALKYPALIAGPRYAAATGRSLIEGYRRQGRHALILFAIITVGTMFTVQAAITVVTASALQGTFTAFGAAPPGLLTSALLVNIAVITVLLFGGFKTLDKAMKILMAVMALATAAVFVIEAPNLDYSTLSLRLADMTTADRFAVLVFAVALVGWMPAPLDIAAWDSMWVLARQRQTGVRPGRRGAMADFHIGFFACIAMALAFLALGTVRLHQNGELPESGAAGFARQLISLYTESLGDWAGPVVGLGALAIMLSTLLTVTDAIPRSLVAVGKRFKAPEPEGEFITGPDPARTKLYWIILLTQVAGGVAILAFLISDLRSMVKLATILSFFGTPALAWLNHRAMTSPDLPAEHRFDLQMRLLSAACVAVWTLFAGLYLYTLLR